ncbi:S8 family serine peptidase [Myroides odoratus]|uniref:S8 family serine peptidase n=1 Tax=Myroides odoratus TaxID=256 RepID=UPI0039AF22ED
MKKNTLLLFSLFSLWSVSLSAQNEQIKKRITSAYEPINKEELQALREEKALARTTAYKIAKENNKPVSGVTKDGGVYSLQRIDADGNYIYYITSNAGSRITAKVNDVAPGGSLGLNLDGRSIKVGVWDGASALNTHVEFQGQTGGSRMTLRNQLPNLGTMGQRALMQFEEGRLHATHVSGTIGAQGLDARAKGIAPAASILSYDWDDDGVEMRAAAQADALLVSNHSYGLDATVLPVSFFGTYMESSQEYDQITYAYKYYQPVVAAGNDRRDYREINPSKNENDLLTGTAVSKNAVVVAAVGQVNSYTGPASVVMSAFSNYGPTNDFRIKPDISAKGVAVFSTSYELPSPVTGNPNNGKYITESGTSMAAPAVSGIIALWQQWAIENRTMPFKSATIRALMVHTADEAGVAPGPDHKFGWGLINAKAGVQVLAGSKVSGVILEENELAQGAIYEKQFTVGESGIKVIVTLAWTDPEGTVSRDNYNEAYAKNNPSLVNDLDLRVFKDGVEYLPWRLNKDFSNLVTLKGDNDVDNIEKVEIDAAETGVYTVKVSHKGVLRGGKQEYSVIMSRSDFNNLSVDEFDLNNLSFSIWPNPTVDVVNVTIPEEVDLAKMTIQLFDLSGRLVKTVTSIPTNQIEVDVKGLSSGVYIMKLKGQGFDKTERIVKK